MERKTHMRAAIVNSMDFIRTLQREDRDAVPSARDDGYLLKLIARSDVDESVLSGPGAPRCRGCQVFLLRTGFKVDDTTVQPQPELRSRGNVERSGSNKSSDQLRSED
jgi:hypothetical protein